MNTARPSDATPPLHSARQWLLGISGAWLLWASCFVWLYAGLSLGCEAGWHTLPAPGGNRLTLALAIAWVAHLLALGALLVWWTLRRPGAGLLPVLARTLSWIALAATLWIGWPVLTLPPCAGLTGAAATPKDTPWSINC